MICHSRKVGINQQVLMGCKGLKSRNRKWGTFRPWLLIAAVNLQLFGLTSPRGRKTVSKVRNLRTSLRFFLMKTEVILLGSKKLWEPVLMMISR